MSKLYYPGYHDLVSGGVMDLQDKADNFENARRELSEELGLIDP
jgi:8-oxo-dGTP pyrophosphatase MutT (NUDIX family)